MARLSAKIVFVNHDCADIDGRELSKVANAIERQVNEHLSPSPPYGYGVDCKIRAATKAYPPKPDEWQLGLFAKPDIEDALGYHYHTDQGQPLMKVFPYLDQADDMEWSVTASHEVLETLVDPNIARCVQAPDGKFWSMEIADAVECDTYEIDGVDVSNFVLPPYFEPPVDLTGLKFDYLGLIKFPFEIRPGGYGQYWAGSRWRSVYSPVREQRGYRRMQHRQGRSAMRAAKAAPYMYEGRLVRVVDGDTVVLHLEQTFTQEVDFGFFIQDRMSLRKQTEQKFRLKGINCPEINTPDGVRARDRLESLLKDRDLLVHTFRPDQYGRWLAIIQARLPDGTLEDVNRVLLMEGLAKEWKG